MVTNEKYYTQARLLKRWISRPERRKRRKRVSFRNRGGRCKDPFVTFLQNFPSQATIISTTTYDYVLHDHETITPEEGGKKGRGGGGGEDAAAVSQDSL